MVAHSDLDALDDDLIDAVLTANVRGPFATIRAFVALLRATGDRVIVNISSGAAQNGTGSSIIYGGDPYHGIDRPGRRWPAPVIPSSSSLNVADPTRSADSIRSVPGQYQRPASRKLGYASPRHHRCVDNIEVIAPCGSMLNRSRFATGLRESRSVALPVNGAGRRFHAMKGFSVYRIYAQRAISTAEGAAHNAGMSALACRFERTLLASAGVVSKRQ